MNTLPSNHHLPAPLIGQCYQLRREVDRDPYFRAQSGLVGFVLSSDEHLIRLQMVEHITDEFDNCIEWYDYEPTSPILAVFYEDCQRLDRYLLITFRMVSPGALCDESNSERDLPCLTQAFRLETQTPQASIFKQDKAAGILTLLEPVQQELTPSQYSWLDIHTEMADYECFF
jgi:hypothetical protein